MNYTIKNNFENSNEDKRGQYKSLGLVSLQVGAFKRKLEIFQHFQE